MIEQEQNKAIISSRSLSDLNNQQSLSQSSEQSQISGSKYMSNSSVDSDNIQKIPQNQFSISEDAANQILTIYLEPTKSIWTKGQIIASNRSLFAEKQVPMRNMDKQLIHFLKLNKIPPIKLTNDSPDLAYYCLRRKGGGGKILFLSQDIYRQKFMFDYSKLLTITCSTDQYTLSSNSVLKYLSKLQLAGQKMSELKNKDPVIITLQGNQGSIIFEKSLGFKQRIYLSKSNILAASQSVTIKKQKNQQIYLEGPGYIFLETQTEKKGLSQSVSTILWVQIIMTILMPVLISMFLVDLI